MIYFFIRENKIAEDEKLAEKKGSILLFYLQVF